MIRSSKFTHFGLASLGFRFPSSDVSGFYRKGEPTNSQFSRKLFGKNVDLQGSSEATTRGMSVFVRTPFRRPDLAPNVDMKYVIFASSNLKFSYNHK